MTIDRPVRQRVRLSARALACALFSAATVPCIAESPFPEESHVSLVERVGTAETGAYGAILADFDTYLAANPEDSIAWVERCQFIMNFAYQEDETIESAYDDGEDCIEALEESELSGRPEVQLFLLEQQWGDEAIGEGEALLSASADWPISRRAALHARLSQLYAAQDEDKAGRHATAAVELDPATEVQIAAASYQLRLGAKRRAVELINSLPEQSWNTWILDQAVDVLLQAGDPAHAYQIVAAKPELVLGESMRYSLARALVEAGDAAAGQAVLRRIPPPAEDDDLEVYRGYETLRKLFEFQRDYGSPQEAQSAYQDLRDEGWRADPFAWYRFSLATASPSAPWRVRDLLGIGALGLLLLVCAVLPLAVVAPIHYRSLAKRVRGISIAEPSAASPWTLKDMWYALCAMLTLMSLALYVIAYPQFEDLVAPVFDGYAAAGAEIDHAALGRAYLFGNLLCLVAMIPLFRKISWQSLLAGQWKIPRSLLIGAGAGFGFVILAAIVKGLLAWNGLAIGPGSETFMALQGIEDSLGPLALLAFACVLTPLLEEFVFRAVVLRASARHIVRWGAVLLQAALFVAWHEDPSDFPLLMLFALGCAWLALRSGGLVAPMAFHAAVNLVAVVAILLFSRAVNQVG
jgi:membrane protease YdiL (CAAX protease family)